MYLNLDRKLFCGMIRLLEPWQIILNDIVLTVMETIFSWISPFSFSLQRNPEDKTLLNTSSVLVESTWESVKGLSWARMGWPATRDYELYFIKWRFVEVAVSWRHLPCIIAGELNKHLNSILVTRSVPFQTGWSFSARARQKRQASTTCKISKSDESNSNDRTVPGE